MNRFRSLFLTITVLLLVGLSACGGTSELATVEGTISFQAPPTSATILYLVNQNNPDQSLSIGVEGSDAGPSGFSVETEPGTYVLFAYELDGSIAAAYLNDANSALQAVTVGAGETLSAVNLSFVFPYQPCQLVALPASPDGLFVAVEANPDCLEPEATEVPEPQTGTVNGQIGFQGPPVPTTVVYFVEQTTNEFVMVEVDANDLIGTFTVELPVGVYKVWGYREDGQQAAAFRPETDTQLGLFTVTADAVSEITLINSYPMNPCQSIAIPASPDGRFAAIEIDTACLDAVNGTGAEATPTEEEVSGPVKISGTISYDAPPSPKSYLYLVNLYTGNWYWQEFPSNSGPIPFTITVESGTYIMYAHPSNTDGSRASAYLDSSGNLGEIKFKFGQDVEGLALVSAAPTSPCQRTTIPASPDGLFPAIFKTC